MMRALAVKFFLLLAALSLAACGGGGGSSSVAGGSNNNSSGGETLTIPAAANVQTVSVESGPGGFVNTLFTSVTVCVPGTTNCQTVDHVMVDTGSSGLRLMASALQSSLILPPHYDGRGHLVAECAQFADGVTWGPLKQSDVQVSGERAYNIAIQVIGDPAYPGIPNECANAGPSENTVTAFGANGVLGVGLFKRDCGPSCLSAGNGFYYLCPCQDSSTSSAVDTAYQVPNPVALFANDNNGVFIELPDAPAQGTTSLTGALVFGIGTQTNNTLGTEKIFKVAPDTGNFVTTYNGRAYNTSLIDSGSSINFFSDRTLSVCPNNDPYAPGFYCPDTTQDLSAQVQGTDSTSATLNFSIANASKLFHDNPNYWAFNNLGAPDVLPNSFIWGLPTFMGRKVFTAIEGQNTSAGSGPYFAF